MKINTKVVPSRTPLMQKLQELKKSQLNKAFTSILQQKKVAPSWSRAWKVETLVILKYLLITGILDLFYREDGKRFTRKSFESCWRVDKAGRVLIHEGSNPSFRPIMNFHLWEVPKTPIWCFWSEYDQSRNSIANPTFFVQRKNSVDC